jgi:hypothetical protein
MGDFVDHLLAAHASKVHRILGVAHPAVALPRSDRHSARSWVAVLCLRLGADRQCACPGTTQERTDRRIGRCRCE